MFTPHDIPMIFQLCSASGRAKQDDVSLPTMFGKTLTFLVGYEEWSALRSKKVEQCCISTVPKVIEMNNRDDANCRRNGKVLGRGNK